MGEKQFNGKAIYNPSGKAGEYSYWACNFYVGCSNMCEYCYCKKGILSNVVGQNKAQLKQCFKDETDALLCVKDGMNFTIADIHTGDKDSSNALCEEIAKRWNEFEEWRICKDSDENTPENDSDCLLRVEYLNEDDGEWYTEYFTARWSKTYGWLCEYLKNITENYEEYKITHWKPINRPKGVEK